MQSSKIQVYSVILILLFLVRCIGSAHEEKLLDNFYLQATDDISGLSICYLDGEYLVGIVPSTVFAVGYNNDFIIAKQHPQKLTIINKSITYYYIVPVKTIYQYHAEENVIGPLTQVEFQAKCEELGVPKDLRFTKNFKDLE